MDVVALQKFFNDFKISQGRKGQRVKGLTAASRAGDHAVRVRLIAQKQGHDPPRSCAWPTANRQPAGRNNERSNGLQRAGAEQLEQMMAEPPDAAAAAAAAAAPAAHSAAEAQPAPEKPIPRDVVDRWKARVTACMDDLVQRGRRKDTNAQNYTSPRNVEESSRALTLEGVQQVELLWPKRSELSPDEKQKVQKLLHQAIRRAHGTLNSTRSEHCGRAGSRSCARAESSRCSGPSRAQHRTWRREG